MRAARSGIAVGDLAPPSRAPAMWPEAQAGAPGQAAMPCARVGGVGDEAERRLLLARIARRRFGGQRNEQPAAGGEADFGRAGRGCADEPISVSARGVAEGQGDGEREAAVA